MKSHKIASLMIGRGGSSLKNKNILPVLGHPLLHWGCAAARRSKYIARYYVSSDCDMILATAKIAGFSPIQRPEYLSTDTAQSCDAVRHALEVIEGEGPIDILVVQHANVGTITEKQIDDCIELLQKNPEATAVVPAHEFPEYHPYRGKAVDGRGYLQPFSSPSSGQVSANRQDLPKCLFFDHSFWVLKGRDAVFDTNGQKPWDCMGHNIMPYETSGCFDVHSLDDLKRTEQWLNDNNINTPFFG